MCDPASAVALGSAVLGSGTQVLGQGQAQSAQRRVAAEEVAAQQGYRDAAFGAARDETAGYALPTVQAAADAGAVRRGAEYSAAVAPQTGYLPGMTGPAVQGYTDAVRRDVADYGQQQAGAKAKLGGWDDALFGAGQRQQRGGERIAVQDNFSRGQAGTLGARLGVAATRGANTRMLGDAITGVGMLATPFAAAPGVQDAWGRVFARDGGMKKAV